MRMIEYNIPVKGGETDIRTGYKVRLRVGDKRVNFVLQMDGSKPAILTHYASGYKLVNLRSEISLYPWYYNKTIYQWRNLAQHWLNSLVETRGLDTVRAKFDSVPVLNK